MAGDRAFGGLSGSGSLQVGPVNCWVLAHCVFELGRQKYEA